MLSTVFQHFLKNRGYNSKKIRNFFYFENTNLEISPWSTRRWCLPPPPPESVPTYHSQIYIPYSFSHNTPWIHIAKRLIHIRNFPFSQTNLLNTESTHHTESTFTQPGTHSHHPLLAPHKLDALVCELIPSSVTTLKRGVTVWTGSVVHTLQYTLCLRARVWVRINLIQCERVPRGLWLITPFKTTNHRSSQCVKRARW